MDAFELPHYLFCDPLVVVVAAAAAIIALGLLQPALLPPRWRFVELKVVAETKIRSSSGERGSPAWRSQPVYSNDTLALEREAAVERSVSAPELRVPGLPPPEAALQGSAQLHLLPTGRYCSRGGGGSSFDWSPKTTFFPHI